VVVGGEFKGTVMGDVKYDQDGLALWESTANEWWDRKQMLVYPFVPGAWKVRLAPTWGSLSMKIQPAVTNNKLARDIPAVLAG
jgi:hypothetical protein